MRFSVIIPVYNVAPYLRACLESLRAQSFSDWEAIAVDDGSTDESGAILDEYARLDARIRVVHQKNSGVAAARNAALSCVRGAWIVYLDADDVYHPRALEVFAQGVSRATTFDLIVLGFVWFGEQSEPGWSKDHSIVWREVDCCASLPEDVACQSFFCLAYRASKMGDLRFPALSYGEDTVYRLRALGRVKSILMADFPIYGYRQRGSSAVHSAPTRRQVADNLRHFRCVLGEMKRAHKTFPPSYCHELGLRLTQYVAEDFFSLPHSAREGLAAQWFVVLRLYHQQSWARGYARFVAYGAARTRCLISLWLLGRAVHWLKRHGVNRRFAWHTRERMGCLNG